MLRHGLASCDALPRKEACRHMVDLLALAHEKNCEAELAKLIAETLAAGQLPDAGSLQQQLTAACAELPEDREVKLTELSSFDRLLEASS